MSFACLQNYLAQQFYSFQPKNGECRFLAAPGAEETDDQGFLSAEFTPRTVDFIKCSWTPKTGREGYDAEIAAQTRSVAVYEITVAKQIDGVPVLCLPSDRIELRTKIGDSSSVILCEILQRVNQNNMAWLVYAVDLDDNE